MNEKINEAGRSAFTSIRQMINEEMTKFDGRDTVERIVDGSLITGATPLSGLNMSGEARVGIRNGTVSR
jgi:hypothetical protein